jgi:nitrate/nitrite transporter NarK
MNLSPSPKTSVGLLTPTRVRYGVLGFACALSMITYLDRVCFGSVAKFIQAEFGLSDSDKGLLFTAFALAYACFEVPSGWLGDRYGARRTLIRIVIWWSVFTALTGLIFPSVTWPRYAFLAMLTVRFLFGMGEAGAYPNISRAFANWFPFGERGFAQGAVWMAGRFAGGVTPLLVLALLGLLGPSNWRPIFWVFGALGAVWCIAFWFWFCDRPEEKASVNQAELDLIRSGAGHEPEAAPDSPGKVPWPEADASKPSEAIVGGESRTGVSPPVTEFKPGPHLADHLLEGRPPDQDPAPPRETDHSAVSAGSGSSASSTSTGSNGSNEGSHSNVPWRALLTDGNLWVLCLMYFCGAYGWYFNITWLPGYLEEKYGVTQQTWGFWTTSLLAGAPLLLGSLACVLGGILTDTFIRRTGNRKWGRRLFGVIGHGVCALCYFMSIYAGNAWLFVLAVAMAAFWNDLTMGSAWASCIDIGKRYAGIVSGCMNTIGNLGGAMAGFTTGKILVWYADAARAEAAAAAAAQAGNQLAASMTGSLVGGLDQAAAQMVQAQQAAQHLAEATQSGWHINLLSYAAVYVVATFLWLCFDATRPVRQE